VSRLSDTEVFQAASTGEYDRGLHPANAVARPLLQATTAIRFEEEIVVSGSERVAGCIYSGCDERESVLEHSELGLPFQGQFSGVAIFLDDHDVPRRSIGSRLAG
jgi:hypothetical protein